MIEGKYIAIAAIWLSCGIAALKDGFAGAVMSFFGLLATMFLLS